MAYIRDALPEERDPSAEAFAARLVGPGGQLDHILAVHSLNPPSLEHHYILYSHLMRGPSPLSRLQRGVIAVAVSAENDCFE